MGASVASGAKGLVPQEPGLQDGQPSARTGLETRPIQASDLRPLEAPKHPKASAQAQAPASPKASAHARAPASLKASAQARAPASETSASSSDIDTRAAATLGGLLPSTALAVSDRNLS